MNEKSALLPANKKATTTRVGEMDEGTGEGMTRGKKEKRDQRDYSRQTADISRREKGVRRRQTNGEGAPRGCILRLVNRGGWEAWEGGSTYLRPNRSHRSVAL